LTTPTPNHDAIRPVKCEMVADGDLDALHGKDAKVLLRA
jgi:hypothetical protein